MRENIVRAGLLPFLFSSMFLTSVFPDGSQSQIHAWRRSLASSTLTVGLNPRNPNSIYARANGLCVSYNKGVTWTPLGPLPPISDLRQILVHPDDTMIIFVVGFSGGLRRSTNYGTTWSLVLPNFGIDGESITYDPHRPDTMYAGNYEDARVYQSTNRGLSWKFVGDAGADMCALSVRPDSTNILYAGTGNGTISKSTDFGVTWRQVKGTGSAEIPKIVIDQSNPMTAYAAGFAGPDTTIGVWKTTDWGEHWALTSLRGISVWALDISLSDPNVVYAGTFTDAHDAVYRTTNGGAVWDTLKTGFPTNGNSWSLKVDPLDYNNVWLAINGQSQQGIYRWVSLRARVQGVVRDGVTNQPVAIGSVKLLSTGDSIYLDQSGQYSFDYFDGDSAISSIVRVIVYPYYIRNEPITFALDSVTTHDIRVQKLPTASVTGSVRARITDVPLSARVTLSGSGIGGPSSASASTNSSGFFQINGLFISYPPVLRYDSLWIDPVFPYEQRMIAPVQLDTLGVSYQVQVDTADVLVVSTAVLGGFLGFDIFRSFYREALDSLGLTSHVWNRNGRGFAPARRANELKKKTAIYYTGRDTTYSLSLPDRDSLIAGINAGVNFFITGQSFVERNDSLARTYVGVRHGGNTGQTFARGMGDLFSNLLLPTSGGTGANNQTSRDILLVDNPRARTLLTYGLFGGQGTAGIRIDSIGGGGRLVLLGFGFEALNSFAIRKTVMQQIIGYFDGSIVVSASEENDRGKPVAFRLGQNYPNPFNPTTTIRFDVAATSVVSLDVFNLLGQVVERLVDGQYEPGEYDAKFDARGLSSGVYFYRLQVRSTSGQLVYQLTKKLVMLK
ncbi:MAG: FlgD ig protein [Bacteroidetes bacterium]|nr:FlgD ig protein [Bacteroidota bacterium]